MKAYKVYEFVKKKKEKQITAEIGFSIVYKKYIKEWFEAWVPPTINYNMDDDFNIIVHDSLNLEDSEVTELPGELTVEGSLNISSSKITELPNNLSVNGYLDITNTKIIKLPADIKVDGKVFIKSPGLTEPSPEGIEIVVT